MRIRLDGLRLQLLGLVILPFALLLLGIAVLGVQVHKGAMRRLVAERDLRTVHVTAVAISEQIHLRETAIQGLVLRLADGAPPERLFDQAQGLLQDFDGGMAVLDSRGRALVSAPATQDWQERPLAQILEASSGRSIFFSSPFDEGQKKMVMVAASAGEHIVVGAFSIEAMLRRALPPTSYDSGSVAFLTDREDNLIASIGGSPVPHPLEEHLGVQGALEGREGFVYRPGSDGEHVVAYSPIEHLGWALVLEEPWESVASPLLDLSLAAPLALIPALIVTLVALWFGARQVIEPLRQLEQRARRVAAGDFDAVAEPLEGIAEIRQLQQTLAWMTRRLQAAQQALQGYIGAITRAQEDERRRLARELHDETIQELIALDHRVQFLSMESDNDQGGDYARELQALHHAIQHAIQGVRRTTRALRPIYLEDLGLAPAVEMLTKDIEAEVGIPVRFSLEGTPRRLDPEVELALYRIVQEALNNIARHARATQVEVRLDFEASRVIATIQDDGVGFELPRGSTSLATLGHYGMIGMQERADLVGGRLEINSVPGEGTTVTVSVPIQRVGDGTGEAARQTA